MQNGGLTGFAAVFMAVSMGSVTILMVWCFYRILTQPDSSGPVGGDRPEGAGGEGTPGPSREAGNL